MPIYELYCADCHTVFSFFSARVDTTASPACPRCARPGLTRKPSTFATLKRRGDGGEDAEGGEEERLFEGLDENRLMGAMESLMSETGGAEGEEDPRQMARLMRRFGDLTGLEMGEKMQDYVARLEAGEDPEHLERDMELDGEPSGEGLEDFFKLKKAAQTRRGRPRIDETLYFL